MLNLKDNKFKIKYLDEALDDIKCYPSNKERIFKIIKRVSDNPMPNNEGGYGKPLGNKNNIYLVNCLKIKLKRPPIRIIYKLDFNNMFMIIIAVNERDEMEAYALASHRIIKNNL